MPENIAKDQLWIPAKATSKEQWWSCLERGPPWKANGHENPQMYADVAERVDGEQAGEGEDLSLGTPTGCGAVADPLHCIHQWPPIDIRTQHRGERLSGRPGADDRPQEQAGGPENDAGGG